MNNKKPIGIVVDDGADLNKETIEKYQIGIVPIKFYWPEIEGLPGENIFQKMREAGKKEIKSFGKTSQPSAKDFLDAFKEQLENFDKVICLTISSKLSGTYNSALQAKRFLEKEGKRIFIIDSLNASCGEGISVLRTIDLIEQSKSAEEILKDLEGFIFQIRLYGFVEDPKWLEAAGRISGFLADWVRRIQKLGIRPVLGIKKGVITSIGVKRGAKDISTALFHELEAKTKGLRSQGKKIRVIITHGDNLTGAQKLKEMTEKQLNNTEVAFLNLIDDPIGTLVGPDALIMAWAPKG